ncbi:diguanylate cyclase domain-containing protein [Ilumatobacter sp.]|uniref:GGDEF domain-containing protein n=1 Tax=Ilumatobacter sp. TaxID=1967498 RepID=UPI003AF4EDF1
MKFVRRASLVFSLVLIVAIAVGYVARTAELAGDRDLGLTASAELGAAQLSSIVDATAVAAGAASDPADAADALASVHGRLGVCVVDAATRACSGDGPMPDTGDLEREQERRSTTSDEPGAGAGAGADVAVYDSLMTVTAVGPSVTVYATTPAVIDVLGSEHAVKATTLLPAGVRVGGFTDDQGLRQTSTVADPASNVYVVATGSNDVHLPPEEYRFYAIIFTLAVILMLLAGITIIVEQRNLLERASFDALTKLPNRSEFERRASEVLANAERAELGVSLLLFDLNGFKQVNDTYGHLAGDEVLKVVGSRLRKAVRDGDVVARWGGDEFVVVMPGIATEEMASRRALQLAEQVAGRTRLDGIVEPLRIKVSVGVSVWPDHGGDLAELVVAADRAMYEAKREGATCRVATERRLHPDAIQAHV